MSTQTTLTGVPPKSKSVVLARHLVSWYYGNFLMSPGNALRDIDEDRYIEDVSKLVADLTLKFNDQKMTHKQFLDTMKTRGIHAKFYRYQKPKPNNCPLCRLCGIK